MSAGVEYLIGVVEGLKTLFTVLGILLAAMSTFLFILFDIGGALDDSDECASDKRKLRIVAMIIGFLLIVAGLLFPTREALTLYYYG